MVKGRLYFVQSIPWMTVPFFCVVGDNGNMADFQSVDTGSNPVQRTKIYNMNISSYNLMFNISSIFSTPIKSKIKDGWEFAGRSLTIDRPWAIIQFDDADDPELYKLESVDIPSENIFML